MCEYSTGLPFVEANETVARHPVNKEVFLGMAVGSISFNKKEDAEAAILAACREYKGHDPVEIGSYRGFTMMLSYDSFNSTYQLSLNGKLHHPVTLGTDARGNLTRIDNVLDGMAGRAGRSPQHR